MVIINEYTDLSPDLTAEDLLTRPLIEMAIEQKKLDRLIDALAPQILKHLILLLASPEEHDSRNHWRSELRRWITRLATKKLKSGNGTASAELYYDALWADEYADPEVGAMALAEEVAEIGAEYHSIRGISLLKLTLHLSTTYRALSALLARGVKPDTRDAINRFLLDLRSIR